MSLEALIEAIHASPVRCSFCICGSGSWSIARLTEVANCSRTLLGADVLYHRETTRYALDGLPRHIVSVEAARRLAQHAFHQSRRTALAEEREATLPRDVKADAALLFGVGATSAIQTSRVRHSKDRVFVCVWGGAVGLQELERDEGAHYTPPPQPSSPAEVGHVYDYQLDLPSHMDRVKQDEQVGLLVLHALAETVARCLPGETELVSSRNGRTYPFSLFRSLLPGSDASTEAASPDSEPRLCATPSRTGPHTVPLDLQQEVSEALQAVLSHASRPNPSTTEVCVLWNKNAELRRAHRVPYDSEDGHADEPQQKPQQPIVQPQDSNPDTIATSTRGPIRLLYPGSFNPLHYGHTELVQAAIRVLRQRQQHTADLAPVQVTYEIAVQVVDKGAIACDDLQRRVLQFLDRQERVAVTNAKLFISKARLFPGHGFLIGMDTAVRVLDPQFYSEASDSAEVAEQKMVAALQRDIGDRGCYFVVGGRKVSHDKAWQDLTSLPIPRAIQHLFVAIPVWEFRVDISSTELRAERQKAAEYYSKHGGISSNM